MSKKLLTILLLCSAFALPDAAALTLTCTPAAVPALVRSEGLAERMGDIVLSCSGVPGAILTGNLYVFLSIGITNRLSAGNVVDVLLTADTGSGPVSTGATPILGGPNVVFFTGLSVTVPPSGLVVFRIVNLRGAVAGQGSGGVQAHLAADPLGTIGFTEPLARIAFPVPGLLAGSVSTMVDCHGSAVPASITVGNLFGLGTAVSAQRVTEGFPTAFSARGTGDDSGTRIMLKYSGFSADARLFVPDAVAGSTAAQPTATGLLHGSATGGTYIPGSGTLLLVRVIGTDANGAGGTLAFTPAGPGPLLLDAASEVALGGGAGMAVYEVVDSSPWVLESAEIPTWLGLPPTGGTLEMAPRQTVSFAPVSDVASATATDPIPRFVPSEPPPDCVTLGDCGSFPELVVTAPTLEFTAEAGSRTQGAWILVTNGGGSVLDWTASLAFLSGAGWGELDVDGRGGAVQLRVLPQRMLPGIYEAVLTIDAGSAGIQNLPVKLTVTPPSNPLAPQVLAVVHAATFRSGPLVPGSLATLWGTHLGGSAVSVTFEGLPARLLYVGETQINLEVPAGIAGHLSVTMVVTVDGVSTAAQGVDLTPMSPGVFTGGILNQDNTLNSPSNAAAGDSAIQVFATGLPSPDVASITAKIHDVWITTPEYAGPAPGIAGVQQVNLRVPGGWPPMNTTLVVCSTLNSTGERACSPEAPLSVK
ncbi:MAG: hypothetical protein ABSD27_01940 [Bryobacteraceae bacterium]|jgi:uncharacterized protein (TIGR03437 family)